MNNKYLLGIFVALLAVYFISTTFSKRPERSFKTELIAVDTTAVTKVILNTKADQHEAVTLEKSGNAWQVTKGGKTSKANPAAVLSLLGQTVLVKTKRVAAKSEEKWAEYEVDDKTGNRVRIYAGDQLLSDFVVGRFSFNQEAKTATTFIRLSEAADIYAVDGFLSMSFGQGYSAYRPKELVQMRGEDMTKLDFQGGGMTYQLTRNGSTWMTSDGQVLDSTKVATYLTALGNSNGATFVDDFNESNIAAENIQSLTISGNNLLSPTVVTAYRIDGAEQGFVIKSSQNQDAYFSSKIDGIYASIFKSLEELK